MSDSEGKGLHGYLKCLEEVFVYSLSRAKIKTVVSRGLPLLKDFDENDFIIVLAGSNDVHNNEPAQLTVTHTQGIRHLCSLGRETNILVNHILY